MKYIDCAFINTEDKPIKVSDWQGLLVSELHDGKGTLILGGIKTYYYPHPDAPNDAMICVYRNGMIKSVIPGDRDYPAIYLLLQAQKSALLLEGV